MTRSKQTSKPSPEAIAKKSYKEIYANFFESPSRVSLRNLLRDHTGETSDCDFKQSWPDATGLAKHILGMGNLGGGVFVIGVAEAKGKSLESVGLDSFKDKADVGNEIKPYIPKPLLDGVTVLDFDYQESEYHKIKGKLFQVLIVESNPKDLPYVSKRSGAGIRENAIYIRKEGKTEEASYEDIQQIINRRISTGYDSTRELNLEVELQELKVLYEQISKDNVSLSTKGLEDIFESIGSVAASFAGLYNTSPNPNYPSESFDKFIKKCIDLKKERILRLLGV